VFVDGTATSDVHLSLLIDDFAPFLMGYGIPMNSARFQQDGARPHTSNAVPCAFFVTFPRRVLSNWYHALFEEQFSWPLTSLT
jgi:hypothetical protein